MLLYFSSSPSGTHWGSETAGGYRERASIEMVSSLKHFSLGNNVGRDCRGRATIDRAIVRERIAVAIVVVRVAKLWGLGSGALAL